MNLVVNSSQNGSLPNLGPSRMPLTEIYTFGLKHALGGVPQKRHCGIAAVEIPSDRA